MNRELETIAIDLAHEGPFALGQLQVRPSTREASIGERRQVLEPRVMQVLVALARRRGEVVSREDLFAACWGGRTVGEESINRCIGAIRRLAETLGGFSITTIARVGYRLDVELAVAGETPASRPAAAGSAAPLLAVLAFDNLSGDPEMAFFSDGVSEEIQQTVTRAAGLKVIGRTSCFQFRGADKTVRRVAEELNATHVLDGAVRRNGPRVRVSAQLIECAGQTTLWSDRYDRDLADVFALQDEIAEAVAAALKVALAPATGEAALDPATHDLYLRARARASAFSAEHTLQTIRMAESVVAAAPTFARAWSFLAAWRALMLYYHGDAARQCGLTQQSARAAAETALSLDPNLGRAYCSLSRLEAWARFEAREALLGKALEVAPNDAVTQISAAGFLNEVGRRREAADLARRAHELDPLDIEVGYAYLIYDEPYDRARWESVCARWPDNDGVALDAIAMAAGARDWEGYDAFVAASRARIETDRSFRSLIWHTRNLRQPDPQSIKRGLERAREHLARTGTIPLGALSSLSELGMTDEVYGLIDRASYAHVFDEAGPTPSGIFSPSVIFARSLIGDIRFVGLCAKLGLAAYWAKTGRWPDCADTVDYDFRGEARRLAGSGPARVADD